MNNHLDSNSQNNDGDSHNNPQEVDEGNHIKKENVEEKTDAELHSNDNEEHKIEEINHQTTNGNEAEVKSDENDSHPASMQPHEPVVAADNNNPQEAENEMEENENTGNENSIQGLITTVTNNHLMSEESIETLREILCSKENLFYKLSMKDEDLDQSFLTVLKLKAKIAENTIGEALNYYHQRLIDSELGHLDKLMKILKTKKRDMYLSRIINLENEEENASQLNEAQDKLLKESMLNQLENSTSRKEFDEFVMQKNSLMLRKLLPEYNQKHNYIRFQLNENYEVYLRVFEEKAKSKASLIDKIPNDVLQNHILIYFNSFDLFKLRAVCTEWRELIRAMWHIIFKREMMEQVIAADLCNDIEMNFKLMSIKSPFYHKFGIIMKAITEVINWDDFHGMLLKEDLDYRVKYLVLTFYKMIGMNVGFNKLSDFQEEYWDHFKEVSAYQLKHFVESIFSSDFKFKSNQELDIAKQDFLDTPDISNHSIRLLGDKNLVMFQLFLKQLSVFSQLKNFLCLAQNYVILAKDKLKEVSKEWPHKKGFLEGAYKILLFKFVQIKDGEVIIAKEEEDEHKNDIIKDIQNELHQCMNITTEIQASNDPADLTSCFSEEHHCTENHESNTHACEHVALTEGSEVEPKVNVIVKINEGTPEKTAEKSTEIPENSENKEECKESPVREISIDDLMNYHLAQIVEIKKLKQGHFFEKFLKGETPDYVIAKNGSETRLYLDDKIKSELLIQKYLKLHVLKNVSINKKIQKENDECTTQPDEISKENTPPASNQNENEAEIKTSEDNPNTNESNEKSNDNA